MPKQYKLGNARLVNGDCLKVLKKIKDNSIDAVVVDPPYQLNFMNKSWDNTGISFRPATWKAVLDVCKPGAHMLCFGGSRTFHRIACAIEDAGWEIRDTLMWVYGSGFPKSLSISKALDKELGCEREDLGPNPNTLGRHQDIRGNKYNSNVQRGETTDTWCRINKPATDAAKKYDGYGTNLKPAWEPIILCRKPVEGTIAQNVLKYGVGGINIDGCRIGIVGDRRDPCGADGVVHRTTGDVYGKATTGEKFNLAKGRWPANVLLSHTENCKLVGTKKVKGYTINRWTDGSKPFGNGAGHPFEGEKQPDSEEEIWECSEDCPVRMLDEQSGDRSSPWVGNKNKVGAKGGKMFGDAEQKIKNKPEYGDKGGASRFFYCAKVSKKERNAGCEDVKNDHPTIKPISLLRYLSKLITPPNGVILDPFMGSGSTGCAALLEGFKFIGIDLDEHYIEIAKARIEPILKKVK